MSIATKLILGTLTLLLLATLPLAFNTSNYFESVSIEKEEDNNFNSAMARGAEVESVLQSLLEKSKTLGLLIIQYEKNNSADFSKAITSILDNDRDIFAVDIYQVDNADIKITRSLVKKKAFTSLSKDETTLEQIRLRRPFPIASVVQGQIEIAMATSDDELPLMAIGTPIARNDLGRVTAITVTYFQVARLQRIFLKENNRSVFLTDARGLVLAHPDEKLVLAGNNLKNHPSVQFALSNSDLKNKWRYLANEADENSKIYSTYVKTALGPVVISEVAEKDIIAPALQARHQSILITSIVISVALFLVFIFSMTFSIPIETLAGFIRQVSVGDYSIQASDHIKSKDEIGVLAKAFDEMVVGLKERAKAYSVMKQGMGASVVEMLMGMREEDLSGQNKTVTVLFSDLRDFTKFSDGHSPEEVVLMLNEYFEVMVDVVARHGGWLDKFIGDAIMAVWGVPTTSENDAYRAVQAALEMRIELANLNTRRIVRGQNPIKIGIGLHCGQVIVGKIGSAERANLTVIGDTVNQSSRIESSTKAFGVDILLSEQLQQVVQSQFATELAGQAKVKGKSEQLRLYKLVGTIDENGDVITVTTDYSEYKSEKADKVNIS